VWLRMDKEWFRGGHHKLHPIWYGLYTITERIGEDAYRLDLPLQLGIHVVINVNNLKLYISSLLDEEVTITHLVDNIPDFQLPLLEDTILETNVRTNLNNQYTSFLIDRKRQTLAQAKWMTTDTLQQNLPHLWAEAMDASELKQGGIGPP